MRFETEAGNSLDDRQMLRDVVALSTLPAVWAGAEPLRVGESLAASLFTTLHPRFVYVRFGGEDEAALVEVAQIDRYHLSEAIAAAVGPAILEWALNHDPDDLLDLPDPSGAGTVLVTTRALGLNGELGVIAAGFARPATPTKTQHLLLNIAATQAATAISNARLLASLRQREESLSVQSSILETIQQVAATVASELDLSKAVQAITDAATRVTGADFGAFFYNVVDPEGARYTLYTLSGASADDFKGFPLPRSTELFAPTFGGEAPVRLDDVLADSRYGKSPPHFGMPPGHLPVRSYMGVPVVSASGEVLGGLFFGHAGVGCFTEQHEKLAVGLSHWAALSIQNARLYEEAQATSRELQDSNDLLSAITRNMSVGLLVMDANGRIEYMNPAAERITGYRLEDVKNEIAHEKVHYRYPDGRPFPMHECPIDSANVSNEVLVGHEDVFVRPDGSFYDVSCNVSPLIRSGARVGSVIDLRDTTEEKRAERQLREANALKDQFLGLVSHELRTPISTVVGNSLILLRRGDLLSDEDRTQALLDIASEGEKLQRVIENLLTLTRMEASLGLDLEPLALDEIVREHIALFLRQNPGRRVELVKEGDACLVDGQRSLLEIVIENLVANAHKYSPADQPIEVRFQVTGRDIELEVRDHGIGINEAELPNLFTPFFRTRAAKDYAAGMGLGLAVCKRIIEAHGGCIWAGTAEGGGSVLRFRLPRSARPREHAETA